MSPHYGNGKICYVEMPAVDIARSAEFYKSIFGWNVRQRGDGSTAFDDSVGEVSGTWIVGRPPSQNPGILVYIWSIAWRPRSTPSSLTVAKSFSR
jgi:uncharacterized protein